MNGRGHGDTVAIDIEVVAIEWAKLDEATRGYLLSRAKSDEERALVPGRLALYPGLGAVIAISLWNIDKQAGALLLEGDRAEGKAWVQRADQSKIFRGNEREMLAEFWTRLRDFGRVVTFNGRGYDGPVLMTRSAIHGVAPSRNLAGKPWEVNVHLDLFELMSFHGATRERMSLEYWCRRFGIESPKGMLDGSQVDRAYRDGLIEQIGDYCLRDARATAELYGKLAPTLLPLFL